jgi:exosortase A
MAEPVNPAQGRIRSAASVRTLWPVVFYCLAVIALFHETAWSLVEIWQRSQTYMHGYIIAPISLWLVWARREALYGLPLRPMFTVQVLLLFGGFIWLLARLIDVNVVQQLAFVGLLIVGIWSLVGSAIARIIAFPLGFLFFSVPVGDGLVPYMMEFTATSTVALIQMTGVPVYREGMFFSLPSGNWSVVYACSGVRYLIASVTLGVLYAYLTYRSLVRRILFILLSIVVPVLANSVRAYIIVMLGHLSDMKLATGVDHLLYGWVFFGVVMFILFWLGSFWREDIDDSPAGERPLQGPVQPIAASARPRLALLTALVATGIWPALFTAVSHTTQAPVADPLVSPQPGIGWQSVADSPWDWSPVSGSPDRASVQFYAAGEQVVGLYVFQYFQQEEGAELIRGLDLFLEKEERWRITFRGRESVNLASDSVTVDRVNLVGGDRELFVWSWYRIGEHYTADRYEAKIWELIELLTFSKRGSVHILLATDAVDAGEGQEILQAFISEHLTVIEAALDTRSMDQQP